MSQVQGKVPILFDYQIPSNTTKTLEYVLSADGTIENIDAYFYAGQQKDLQLEIYLLLRASNQRFDLVHRAKDVENGTYTKNTLSGDNTSFKHDVSVPFSSRDKIIVVATNADTNGNDYDVDLTITVDYLAGKARVV